MVVSKIDEYGKAAWLLLVLGAFWFAWPIALMLLAFLYGSGRIQGWQAEARAGGGTWFGRKGTGWTFPGTARTSGNAAFDDYREATLRTLEEEEQEFKAFLDRLRKARDKAEFDAFMAERRPRSMPEVSAPRQPE